MRKQAQLDWKENISFLLSSGETVVVNVFVLLLSYSRFRVYRLSMSKTQDILELTTLRFMENAENIVFLGSNGVGITHLATSIGIASASKRYSTYFIKCNHLLQQLKKLR